MTPSTTEHRPKLGLTTGKARPAAATAAPVKPQSSDEVVMTGEEVLALGKTVYQQWLLRSLVGLMNTIKLSLTPSNLTKALNNPAGFLGRIPKQANKAAQETVRAYADESPAHRVVLAAEVLDQL